MSAVRNDPAFRELARQLVDMRRRVDGMSRPQLNRSSLENGSINTYGPEGELVATYGRLPDGTFGTQVVSGPTPPTPTAPNVTIRRGTGLEITWDGSFTAETANFPLSGGRLEVYIHTSDFIGGEVPPRSSMTNPRGGTVTLSVDYNTAFYVGFRLRADSGKLSGLSEVVGPYTVGALTAEDLDLNLEALAGTTIFYQDTEPVTDKADLWLDLDPISGNHVAKRYNPTTESWETLNDQRVVQALLEAQAASSAAEQAGVDALAAQGTANTAQTAAGDAATAAQAAANVAAGKTTTFRQADAPSITGRTIGDEWIETDQGNRRHVWTGAWTLTQLGSAAISATARQLGAITTYRQATAPTTGMIVGDFWIRSTDNRIHRYEGTTPTWVESKDTEINTAITNAATAQATADGKVRIFPQDAAPTGLVAGDVGDLWINTTPGQGNRVSTWDGDSWEPRLLGNAAIQPQSLVASNVIATGTVSAALLEALMVLASVIIVGDPNGEHVRIDPSSGLVAYAEDPIDSIPNEVGRFGRTAGGRDPVSGRLTWQIDTAGVGSFQRIVVEEKDPSFGGSTLNERDWERPWGIVGYGHVDPFNPPDFTRATPDELGITELAFDAIPGREYKLYHDGFEISTDWTQSNTDLGQRGTAAILGRLTTDGSTPYVNSPNIVIDRLIGDVKADYATEVSGAYLISGPPIMPRNVGESYGAWRARIGQVRWRILLSFAALPAKNFDGSLGKRWIRMGRFTRAKVWIEDVGPQRPNIGRPTDGLPPTGTTPPPAPAAKVTRTIEYPVTWSGSWPQSNNWTVSHRQGYVYQGKSNGYDNYGAQAGAWGWNHDHVRNDTAGATIDRVEIYMYAYHWHNMSGGIARIGWNGGTGTGGAFPGGKNWFERHFGRGQGQWIDITGWGWRLQRPFSDPENMRGIGVGEGASHDLTFYGYFAGGGDIPGRYPSLRVTFTK